MRLFVLGTRDVWTVGAGGAPHHASTAHWDGTRWRTVPTPELQTQYNQLVGTDERYCPQG
jgi:hypothetical protein